MIVIVQANKSGVARKILAWCKLAPIDPLGIPITSAAMPDFQLIPSPTRQAALKKGNICEM